MKIKKGDYLVIETTCNSEPKIEGEEVLKTPFQSVIGAQAQIRKNASDCVDSSSLELEGGKDKNWGSNFFIVQVVKIVRPVPVAKIEMSIMEVK